jgi:hypothetical protein
MGKKIKAVLKNKKFWAAVAVASSLAGGYNNPQAVTAVGEMVTVLIEASETPQEAK